MLRQFHPNRDKPSALARQAQVCSTSLTEQRAKLPSLGKYSCAALDPPGRG